MFRAVARFAGLHVFFFAFDPGACAPGFMLSPASRAKQPHAVAVGFAPKRASHPRQWVDWFRSLLQTYPVKRLVIPPTAVGGYFKPLSRKDLNDPPTTVGGISTLLGSFRVESI